MQLISLEQLSQSQRLMIKPTIKELQYNLAQMLFVLSYALITILEWGRGTGKSTIIARRIIDCVTQMPRSTGALAASSYTQIKTRTLPSTIAGLESHGVYKDIHYVVGKRPPKNWNWLEPYEPPLDYKNAIIFWNGTVLVFISQDGSGSSGRGMNVDWVVGDEAALLKEEKFETDVLLTNRGNKRRIAEYPDGSWKYFGDCQLHHSILLASSTPVTLDGRWILKYEKEAVKNPKKVKFIRASAEVNRDNLGDEYFENAKAIMSKELYEAEVENIRMNVIDNGFYPLLSETKHVYNPTSFQDFLTSKSNRTWKADGDLDINQSLILGIDWGTRINCMVVAQGNRQNMNFVNNLYVKSPQIVADLIDEFKRYYKDFPSRTLYVWYDPTGNIKTANSRETVAQQVKSSLEEDGWKVQLMTQGVHNELHEAKYNLWNNILQEDPEKSFPKIKFNRSNSSELWISMTNAPAIQGRNDSIRKDKRSEKSKVIPQEHATHLSDAADVIIVGMYKELMFTQQSVGEPILL
jgi:hypothetical protein